ncbi:MAG: HAD-IA family hydrolase [Holophaga sp.]|jgi:FMN phosphatase YigB (HAD superfamily)
MPFPPLAFLLSGALLSCSAGGPPAPGGPSRKDTVIIWDSGGVLLRWNIREMARAYADGRFEPQCLSLFQGPAWRDYDRGDLSFSAMAEAASREIGLPPDRVMDMARAALVSLAPQWDVIRLVQAFKAGGMTQFCMTNGSLEYWALVSRDPAYRERYHFHMESLFPDVDPSTPGAPVWLSARHRLLKPEPEAYRSAEAQFRLDRAATRIIFVDDSPANVEAAVAHGWDGILFTGRADLLQQEFKARSVAG